MAPKTEDGRLEKLEIGLDEVREGLRSLPELAQRFSVLEQGMAGLVQSVSQLLQRRDEWPERNHPTAATGFGEQAYPRGGVRGDGTRWWTSSAEGEGSREHWQGAEVNGNDHRRSNLAWAPGSGGDRGAGKIGRWLELPVFDGSNPDDWILRAELYFSANRLSEAERLMAAGNSFEDEALIWFVWTQSRRPFASWKELKSELLSRFGSSQKGSLWEVLLGLKQQGTVAEFCQEFELIAASMEELPEELLEAVFIKGLKAEIQSEIRELRPVGLHAVMKAAQLIEVNNRMI